MLEISSPKMHRKHYTQVLLNCIFVTAVPVGAVAGKQIVTSYKSCKTEPQELIADETKMMVLKSLDDFGAQYMYEMFTKTRHFIERNLRKTITNFRLPLRKSTVGQKNFSYRGAKV